MKLWITLGLLILISACDTIELEKANEKLSSFAIRMTAENLEEKLRVGRYILSEEERCGRERIIDIYNEVATEVMLIVEFLKSQTEVETADTLHAQLQVYFTEIDSIITRESVWLGVGENQLIDFRATIAKKPFYYGRSNRLVFLLDGVERSCARALSIAWPIYRGCGFYYPPFPHLSLAQHEYIDSVYVLAYFDEKFCSPELGYFTICDTKVEIETSIAKAPCLRSVVRNGTLNWEVSQVNANTGQVSLLDGKWTSEVSWF